MATTHTTHSNTEADLQSPLKPEEKKAKALIAMSGGVDSSVAAYLMKEAGHECIGCTMRLHQNQDAGIPEQNTCCSLDDVEDARSVAFLLKMPYYVFNFSDDFREKVINRFIWNYQNGRTPNPCIDCNRYMKFDKLFERAKILECDLIVTGHYARIEKQGEGFVLKKALDPSKDQSYVLYSMTQEQLAHTAFPLGGLHKDQVRELARSLSFINSDKPDSQDICFVPDGNYAQIIRQHTGKEFPQGAFLDPEGNQIGTHKGIINYTIGQRKGLGLFFREPHYVCAIDAANNTVTVGTAQDLLQSQLVASDFNWISGQVPTTEVRCKAKIRYKQQEQDAVARVQEDGSVCIRFDESQSAIAPGQAVVLYDGDVVLGGGTIQ